jgi:hypothetical protein
MWFYSLSHDATLSPSPEALHFPHTVSLFIYFNPKEHHVPCSVHVCIRGTAACCQREVAPNKFGIMSTRLTQGSLREIEWLEEINAIVRRCRGGHL